MWTFYLSCGKGRPFTKIPIKQRDIYNHKEVKTMKEKNLIKKMEELGFSEETQRLVLIYRITQQIGEINDMLPDDADRMPLKIWLDGLERYMKKNYGERWEEDKDAGYFIKDHIRVINR